MLQKINEKKKIQSRNENKVYVSRNENKKIFNCDKSFVHFNLKKYCNLNRKKHETKNEQIIERTSF